MFHLQTNLPPAIRSSALTATISGSLPTATIWRVWKLRAAAQPSCYLISRQMLVYHKTFEEYPLFLVDDVDAELDRKRIETLLDYLEDKPQTIVSTSKRSIGERYRGRARVIFIASGRADGFEPEGDHIAFHSSEEYLPAYES
jgi:hypothetical protein